MEKLKPTSLQGQELELQKQNELIEALNSPFPSEFISIEFAGDFANAIEYETVHSLKCNWEQFKELLNMPVGKFTIAQMGLALNAVTNRTMIELVQINYQETQDRAYTMAAKWNEIVSATRKRLDDKYSNMAKLSV